MTDSKVSAPPPAGLPEVMKGKRQLGPEDVFPFGCHSGISCFTGCCADVNILLTPLDVLRLARKLGVSTGEFLDRYTLTPITKELHLPVKLLKMDDEPQRKCPFVVEGGCTVYDDRPWACRMYPLGMGLPPAHAGEEPEPVYFLFEDDFCKGRSEPREWRAREWRDDQGVMGNEEIERGFREIVGHPWFIGGGRKLDPKRLELFHMVCYDLDTFRRFVFESTFLKRYGIGDESERLREDDIELLKFGFYWLRHALFGEPFARPGGSRQVTPRESMARARS